MAIAQFCANEEPLRPKEDVPFPDVAMTGMLWE